MTMTKDGIEIGEIVPVVAAPYLRVHATAQALGPSHQQSADIVEIQGVPEYYVRWPLYAQGRKEQRRCIRPTPSS